MFTYARRRASALAEGALVAIIVALLAGLTGMTALTAAAPRPTGPQQSIEGSLSIRHGDDFSSGRITGHSYFLTSEQGETELVFEGTPPEGRSNGARVRVRGLASGRAFLVAAGGTEQLSSAATSVSATVGAKRIAIVLLNFSNDAS